MADNTWENNLALTGTGAQLPFSYEAEQSVLGAILLESSCLNAVMEILPRADYFYQVNNRMIYETMLEMFTEGKPIDYITVLERLRENDGFDETTGKVYLMQLAELVPSISNVEAYAKIVRDKYDVRTLILASKEIMEDASDAANDATDVYKRQIRATLKSTARLPKAA